VGVQDPGVGMKVEAGQFVKVGPRYVMADQPPFSGRGRFEADAYTGRIMRVLKVTPVWRQGEYSLPEGADLAPTEPPDAEEEVWICTRRLTPL
jgi:hypothetical protein